MSSPATLVSILYYSQHFIPAMSTQRITDSIGIIGSFVYASRIALHVYPQTGNEALSL